MTDKKPIPMPAGGGSFIRNAKGKLKQIEGPDMTKDDKPNKGETAKDSADKTPVKEA
ncbi:MAG: hypothetical protein JKX71_12910 [Amylibacter sp.]|nr:hypothetical protein [Amylibacter sp.]